MKKRERTLSLELQHVDEEEAVDGVMPVALQTNGGTIPCLFHEAPDGDLAVLWVFGAGGGLGGPAGGLYGRLASQLAPEGIASLRVDYRQPGSLGPCILDTLFDLAYLASRDRTRVVLVGHSFGGAVVISTGAMSDAVIGVAALSSQTYGTDAVNDLTPRPLLLMHGAEDEILPDSCSRDIYRRAREPKKLLLYPGCRHGLDDCRDAVDEDLMHWLHAVLLGGKESQAALTGTIGT